MSKSETGGKKMKKCELLNDMHIIGWGTVEAGTQFMVEKYNKRFVYVRLGNCSLRLSLREVKKVY